ncbi:glycosyl transferase group 1 [[Leptolyngbya] sp. PCC 7376]|uniref:glycosyltransferase n=1 Tax=[Leptolyngbya] sp. PCC 7376 TaxID=111781 RepID=UPI00029F34E5|nr:glycosyltransferase [[Leptolyngbya] sp. PCC 7376]AFY39841.1 glycosyl transferase group 1 [[Leptolyngbya] sp. PCC 7376]
MRPLYFLVPGVSEKFSSGGLFAEINAYELAAKLQTAHLVTYREQSADHLFLPEVLEKTEPNSAIFVISWGFDIPHLIKTLRSHHVIYHAHSTGYNFKIPSSIPILTVSRNSMGYWGDKAPNNLIFHLPNQIAPIFNNRNLERDIDVLVQKRKTSSYVLNQLIPELQKSCRVKVLDHFVPDLSEVFNRSKIYIYDSAEYWGNNAVSEGFGLPPLEAIACGCEIFSSVNGALADYLDPGFNCKKISTYNVKYDGDRILKALENFSVSSENSDLVNHYREAAIVPRLETILKEVNHFFDYKEISPPTITTHRKNQFLIQLKLELRKLRAKFRT